MTRYLVLISFMVVKNERTESEIATCYANAHACSIDANRAVPRITLKWPFGVAVQLSR
jgi:hypothetical protein